MVSSAYQLLSLAGSTNSINAAAPSAPRDDRKEMRALAASAFPNQLSSESSRNFSRQVSHVDIDLVDAIQAERANRIHEAKESIERTNRKSKRYIPFYGALLLVAIALVALGVIRRNMQGMHSKGDWYFQDNGEMYRYPYDLPDPTANGPFIAGICLGISTLISGFVHMHDLKVNLAITKTKIGEYQRKEWNELATLCLLEHEVSTACTRVAKMPPRERNALEIYLTSIFNQYVHIEEQSRLNYDEFKDQMISSLKFLELWDSKQKLQGESLTEGWVTFEKQFMELWLKNSGIT